MINTNMRTYNYFTLGENNGYGQPTLSPNPVGTIRMAIYIASQSIQENINFLDCNLVGLTMNDVDDTYVIEVGSNKMKVLYIQPQGRYKQVYMKQL